MGTPPLCTYVHLLRLHAWCSLSLSLSCVLLSPLSLSLSARAPSSHGIRAGTLKAPSPPHPPRLAKLPSRPPPGGAPLHVHPSSKFSIAPPSSTLRFAFTPPPPPPPLAFCFAGAPSATNACASLAAPSAAAPCGTRSGHHKPPLSHSLAQLFGASSSASTPFAADFSARRLPELAFFLQPQFGAVFRRISCLRFLHRHTWATCLLRFQRRFRSLLRVQNTYRFAFLLHIRGDNLWASFYIIREVFLRLFHCCFGVFSLLCGLFQGGTALQTLCFCPIYPLLRLSLAYPLSWVPSLPEDTFSRSFLALFLTPF